MRPSPRAHRQVVLTIPKRLRLHTRFDRQLLGKLCTCVWDCIQAEVRRLRDRDDVVPGMVAAIHRGTRSRVAANCGTGTRTSTRWSGHPVLRVGGEFTPDGEFLELPELNLERLQAAWQEARTRPGECAARPPRPRKRQPPRWNRWSRRRAATSDRLRLRSFKPNLGHAHQAAVRDRPTGLS